MTDQGGSSLLGTIFRISTDGSSYETLHTFESGKGYWPRGALLQASDGLLYGTTYSGGPTNGGGVVYRIDTNGLDYVVLHAFPGGAGPGSSLVQTIDGTLYGTTEWGGNHSGGVVFCLRPDGSDYSVLHHFAWSSSGDGSHPIAGLIDQGGALFGTTHGGGLWGMGTVYRLILSPKLSISRSPTGPRLLVTGFRGQTCQLDATTDFSEWTLRANLILANGTAEFVETNAIALPKRIYRAVSN